LPTKQKSVRTHSIEENLQPEHTNKKQKIRRLDCEVQGEYFFKTRDQEIQEENEWLVLEQERKDTFVTETQHIAPIDPKHFYDAISEQWKQKLALLTQPIQEISHLRRQTIGRVFSRQEDAFKFIDLEENRSADLRPFSFEKEGLNGTRKFLAVSYEHFWSVYEQMTWGRHFYEVIREERPCCLYFDIEFNRDINPTIRECGSELIDVFLEYLSSVTIDTFGIRVTRNDVIDLDSTTPTKFSRHLIVRNIIFKNNQHCGNFVRYLMNRLHFDSVNNREKHSQIERLFVKTDKENVSVFVDLAVYSRNRNFRIYKSTKFGKETPLLLSSQNAFPFKTEKELFLQSLICNVSTPKETHLTFEESVDMNRILPFGRRINYSTDVIQKGDRVTETNSSPFPRIDKFVAEFLKTRKGSNCGYLRNWLYFEKSGLLVYSVANNRYCENIGREHKSNHIMLCVDLQHGVIFQKW